MPRSCRCTSALMAVSTLISEQDRPLPSPSGPGRDPAASDPRPDRLAGLDFQQRRTGPQEHQVSSLLAVSATSAHVQSSDLQKTLCSKLYEVRLNREDIERHTTRPSEKLLYFESSLRRDQKVIQEWQALDLVGDGLLKEDDNGKNVSTLRRLSHVRSRSAHPPGPKLKQALYRTWAPMLSCST